MKSQSSSPKARRKADPFDLSRRRVVESLHVMDVMDTNHPIHQLEARTGDRKKRKLRRSRWGLRFLKVAAVVVSLISLTAFGQWAYQRAFFENPDFCLKTVELAVPEGFSATKVLEVAGVEQGMKMMGIDLKGMRDRLSEIPLVSKVEVSREFPDKLMIVIEEARPIAWLACPAQGIEPYKEGNGWLIGEKGDLVKCEAVTARLASLPVIQVNDVYVSEQGTMTDSPIIRAALELMEVSSLLLKGEGLEIVEVVATNSYSLQARYSNRMEVVFGLSDMQEALMDLRTILERTRADGKLLATVNLRVRRNIPVTYYQPPVAKPVELEGESESDGEEKTSKKEVKRS
ncbi:MAG: FtsQ-type POTRA domain-containing protein [Verrucomicrobiota bacterium]